MSVILFFLASYGVSNIIIYGSIFESFRNFLIKYNPSFFGALVTCFICLPFWVGVVMSSILSYYGYNISPFGIIGIKEWYLKLFLDGVITSGTVWLIHTIQERIENFK